jgi:hypothetical protein
VARLPPQTSYRPDKSGVKTVTNLKIRFVRKSSNHIHHQIAVVRGIELVKEGFLNLKFKLNHMSPRAIT